MSLLNFIMSQKIYLTILKTGIYLAFLSVFLVFKNLLFPYITSKQLYFNIIIEILAVFWLALIIKYPAVRPKKSWITFGLAAFASALLVSSVFGVDFNLSFWGDIERMLGLFHVAHFFLFYLIVITAFRQWRDWRNLFIASVVAAVAVCLYSLFKIPHSTIGNTAYVSGYAIFNIYFALILFFRRRGEEKAKHQDWLVSALYLVAAFIMFLVMKQTNTRGAYVGLGVSFILLFVLAAVYSQSKKIKKYSLIAAVSAVALIVLIFSFPQSNLVKNTPILRTAAQISLKQVTFQTRLISWKAALKDFPSHIFLGTGYGNFSITFDKYFDPKFYSYTSSETYFDRAHNNLVDITSTGGLVSLLTYLSIFVAVFYYLLKGKKQGKISTNEFILLVCLFVAYFIQNLAVFDSLVTYISLMLALGYVYWLINSNEADFGSNQDAEAEPISGRGLTNKKLAILIIAGLFVLFIIYQYNIKVWQMLNSTIKGQVKFAQGDIAAGMEEYKKALSYKTVLDRDSRASLINFLASNANALSRLDRDKTKEILDFAIKQAEANVKYNPVDSMMQMQLAMILNTAALAHSDKADEFYYFSDQALEAIDKSIAASPGRVTIYFTKAQIQIIRGEKDKAIATLKYAVSLNPEYGEPYCNLAKALLYYKDNQSGFAYMDRCLDSGGASGLGYPDILKVLLDHYLALKDWPRVAILYQQSARLEPKNAKILIELAKVYKELGDKNRAIETAKKVGEIDPQFKASADIFIDSLK